VAMSWEQAIDGLVSAPFATGHTVRSTRPRQDQSAAAGGIPIYEPGLDLWCPERQGRALFFSTRRRTRLRQADRGVHRLGTRGAATAMRISPRLRRREEIAPRGRLHGDRHNPRCRWVRREIEAIFSGVNKADVAVCRTPNPARRRGDRGLKGVRTASCRHRSTNAPRRLMRELYRPLCRAPAARPKAR